jgi:hypothetical protein
MVSHLGKCSALYDILHDGARQLSAIENRAIIAKLGEGKSLLPQLSSLIGTQCDAAGD